MRRFVISSILAIIFIISQTAVLANQPDNSSENELLIYGVYDKTSAQTEYVTREDMVIAIMKMAGVTSDNAINFAFKSFYYSPVFNDIKAMRIEDGYIIKAAEIIAKGTDDSEFEPSRNVTLSEALTFMLRCLNPDASIEPSYAVKSALNEGLVFKTDGFYTADGGSLLTAENASVLLERMLSKPAGYTAKEADVKGITYREYLQIKIFSESEPKGFDKNISADSLDKLKAVCLELNNSDIGNMYGEKSRVCINAELPVCVNVFGDLYPKDFSSFIQSDTSDISMIIRNFYAETGYSYIELNRQSIIVSPDEGKKSGIVYMKDKSENEMRKIIPFLKTLTPTDGDWYTFDTYIR